MGEAQAGCLGQERKSQVSLSPRRVWSHVLGTSGLPGHQQPTVDGEMQTQNGRKWGAKSQGLHRPDSEMPL